MSEALVHVLAVSVAALARVPHQDRDDEGDGAHRKPALVSSDALTPWQDGSTTLPSAFFPTVDTKALNTNGTMRNIILAAVAMVALPGPAASHPHVWVSVRSEIVYAPDGKAMTAVRHSWTFDKAYSTYSTQGLDKNGDGKVSPDELADLAKLNVESLGEFGFFTHAKAEGKELEFSAPVEPEMKFADGELTLSFLLPLKAPRAPSKIMVFDVSDPSYFVAFSLAETNDAVRLAGAPNGCKLTVVRPTNDEKKQPPPTEDVFTAMGQSGTYGNQFANKAIVACP